MDKILNIYNMLFPTIIAFLIVILMIYAMKILNDTDKRRKRDYKIAVSIVFQRMFEHIIVFGILFLILILCFDINIYSIVLKYNLSRVVFGIMITYYVNRGRKIYNRLQEEYALDCATSSKLESYKISIEVVQNNLIVKIDLLKAFAPISLISVIASYFLGNNEQIDVDWNMYLIIFMIIIGIYIILVIDTYSKLVSVGEKSVELQKRMITTEENQGGKLNRNQEVKGWIR